MQGRESWAEEIECEIRTIDGRSGTREAKKSLASSLFACLLQMEFFVLATSPPRLRSRDTHTLAADDDDARTECTCKCERERQREREGEGTHAADKVSLRVPTSAAVISASSLVLLPASPACVHASAAAAAALVSCCSSSASAQTKTLIPSCAAALTSSSSTVCLSCASPAQSVVCPNQQSCDHRPRGP